MGKKTKVIVIFGGTSSEHEVSRISARSVVLNIDKSKYDPSMIGITKDGRWLGYDGPPDLLMTDEWQKYAENKNLLIKADLFRAILPSADVVDGETCGGGTDIIAFPVLHGSFGEDGTIQGLFEMAGVPYVGSGVKSSAICMDKAYANIVFNQAGIPHCKYVSFIKSEYDAGKDPIITDIENELGYPCFVKPSNAGSSIGITKAHSRDELLSGINDAFGHDRRLVIEESINGREIECSVLGNDYPETSVVGEVIPCNEFYDYSAKYLSDDSSRVIIPASVPDEISAKIRQCAAKAYKACDCAGMARVDFFLEKNTGRILINEINTIPGFTSISMYTKLWAASGIAFPELVERLIGFAIEKFNQGGSKWGMMR